MWVWSLGWEDPLEEEMETHSSIPAWKNPWAEESGGLWSTGSQRVRHDWSSLTHMHACSGVNYLITYFVPLPLILYLISLLNWLILELKKNFFNCLCRLSCHPQIGTILFLWNLYNFSFLTYCAGWDFQYYVEQEWWVWMIFFGHVIMQCVKLWYIYITQLTNIFQISSSYCHNSCMVKMWTQRIR